MIKETDVKSSGFENMNWGREWARAYAQSSLVMRKAQEPSYWEKRAKRFSTINNGAEGRAQALMDIIGVTDQTSIIDIGCGPGNLAVPLAQNVGTVTALDPAKAMLEKLVCKAEECNVTNITTINKGWEDAVLDGDIVSHDIVLSSYALIMKDISKALAAMNDTAAQTVCLFWFAGRENFGYARAWKEMYGEDYVGGPDHILLLNVLNELGIYPNVTILPQVVEITYKDFDDAVACYAQDLYATTEEHMDIIRKTLTEELDMSGEYPVNRRNVRSAMIWWNKE
ncbi:MAG: class I SAM-dependent methyltransferase [Desulfovibrio sp.]